MTGDFLLFSHATLHHFSELFVFFCGAI